MQIKFVPHRKHLWTSRPSYGDNVICLCIDDIRTSHTPKERATMACYGNDFAFLYVDDVHTSQGTHVCASTACYESKFFFSCDVFSEQNLNSFIYYIDTLSYGVPVMIGTFFFTLLCHFST
jgi:hypothetical protein